jgi:outer membrane protein OmpA-like peptidoglycan-associated protein
MRASKLSSRVETVGLQGIDSLPHATLISKCATPANGVLEWSSQEAPYHPGGNKMKNRIVTLLLAAVLAVPAFAQTSSAPQAQSQDQNQAQVQTPAAQPAAVTTESATGKPLQPPAREGFWGRLNPWARKNYVKRQVDPIRDRNNELDELTAANSKMIKDTDARAQQGIQLASAKANEADQHAIDAGNKAQAAQQTANQANTRLSNVEQVVGNIDQYKATNQTEIRFRPGQSVLSTNAKAALDDMATPLKNQRGYIVEVQGFSSGHGQAAIATSQKMADAVVRYLVLNHEIPVYRIYVVGMGNAPAPTAAGDDAKTKRTSGGRVEISLLKNDLETLATTSSTAAPASQDQSVQK